MALRKIRLEIENSNQFVYVDPTQIKAIQVQYPTVSSELILQGEHSIGVVRIFLNGMSHPFQFTRETKGEIDEVVHQLIGDLE